jgi:hypothetical protein
MCPGARRLRAGAPLTILRFSPLAQLHLVMGFHAIYCVCARFIQEGCNFVDAETTSLKGETSWRPNFFVFRPIEVSKEPRQGFLDALKPLEQSVCQFEHCKTCF